MVATLCLMSSCSLYRTFKTPEAKVEAICGDGVAVVDDSTYRLPSWQHMFADASLQELIEKGLSSNSDLQIARLNIEQAEAMLLSAKLSYFPSFALAPQGTINKVKDVNAQHSYNLPLTAQWELDIFGRVRNSKQQAKAAVMQSEEYVKMVETQMISAIANTYYTLVMLDEQFAITEQNIDIQRQNLEVITAMKEAGMQTQMAVDQAEAAYYGVQTSAKDLQKQIKLTENSMAILLNETPHAIKRVSMANAKGVNIDYTKPIELSLLANRPDVKSAEYTLSQSFYGVNVARSAFYPSISLSGSAGWTNNLGAITNPGTALFTLLGSLTQPLFNRGMNRANLKVAKAQYEQSLIGFHKSLLVAGSEVNDALVACQNSAAKKELRSKQVVASEQALSNSSELMKHSSTTYLEVLMAQSSLLQSKLSQVADWFEATQGEISLYKALGGK